LAALLAFAVIFLLYFGRWGIALLVAIPLATLLGLHVHAAQAAGYGVSTAIMSVLGLFLFSYLLLRSQWLYRRRGVVWKGRTYRVNDAAGRDVSSDSTS